MFIKKNALLPIFIAILLLSVSLGVSAKQQSSNAIVVDNAQGISPAELKRQQQQAEAVLQLREVQATLKLKLAEREQLLEKTNNAEEVDAEALRLELQQLDSELELLERTFEQIAIGGIDLSVFGAEEEKFNWREELVLIVEPLIENIKGLTEKPRKIESLRRIISEKSAAKLTSNDAIKSVKRLKEEASLKPVVAKLDGIQSDWMGRVEDLDREIQLAEYQLESLQGKNVRWFDILKQGALDFATGRGLTIVLTLLAGAVVWAFMRFLLWLIRIRASESHDRSSKTHYRLAAYAYRFLTAILIAMAIMMVLYFRQDLLLLAVMVIVFFGAALALKNLLPKYITESRLLLNMGSVREKERVIYNGLPWQVSSINVHSRLINPEIRGALRLPIGLMHEMVSRPGSDEPWFPSSEEDWILDETGDPVRVVQQSVDVVELQDLNSVTRFMPTADYYRAGYPNLSRAEVFRISVVFGIDYATQKEDLEAIEAAFKQGITDACKGTPYEEFLLEVGSEFHSAGDSSLNYLMLTRFKPEAAQYYNRIKRRIQRACVMVCNQNDWGIPFPQLSVHLPESAAGQETDQQTNAGDQQSE